MKKTLYTLGIVLCALLLAGAVSSLTVTESTPATPATALELPAELGIGGGPLDRCPRDINCPDVYDPVTCDGGVTYPNACYAFAACATGCGSGGV